MGTTTAMRTAITGLVAGALLAACATSGSDVTAPTPEPSALATTEAASPEATASPSASEDATPGTSPETLVTALTGDCETLPPIAEGAAPQVSFVRDGGLYVVDAIGGEARCVAPDPGEELVWGRAGDRYLAAGQVHLDGPGSGLTPVGLRPGFTRPTGSSVIAIEDDGRSLVKTRLEDGSRTDISFLGDHDEVTYYPSGTHVLAIGSDGDATYGIWMATNTGTDVTLLAEGPEGGTLRDLRVSDDGRYVVFVAEHDGSTHIHRAVLLGESLDGGTDEAAAETVVDTADPVTDLAIDGSGFGIAASAGDCATRPRSLVGTLSDLPAPPAGDVVPVGWAGGVLVVAVVPGGCVGRDPADLWTLWPDGRRELLVEAVTNPAVRRAPEPPPPPPTENFSGFA